jgi:hypothetical protein
MIVTDNFEDMIKCPKGILLIFHNYQTQAPNIVEGLRVTNLEKKDNEEKRAKERLEGTFGKKRE